MNRQRALRRARVRPHPPSLRMGMGDAYTDMIDAKATSLETVAHKLTYEWKPTGFYKPDEMTSIISRLFDLQERAVTPVRDYILNNRHTERDAAEALMSRLAQQFGKLNMAEAGKSSMMDAINAAKANGKYVDAPQFKMWVIKTLLEIVYVTKGITLLNNNVTWAQKVMTALDVIYRNTVSIIRTVAGVAWSAVKMTGAYVGTIPDTLGTLVKVGKIAVIGYGAWWLYQQVQRFRS